MNKTPSPRFLEGRPHSPWTAARQRKKNRSALQNVSTSSSEEDEGEYASSCHNMGGVEELWNQMQQLRMKNKVRFSADVKQPTSNSAHHHHHTDVSASASSLSSGDPHQQPTDARTGSTWSNQHKHSISAASRFAEDQQQQPMFWPTSMSLPNLSPSTINSTAAALHPTWAGVVEGAAMSLSADPGVTPRSEEQREMMQSAVADMPHRQTAKRRSSMLSAAAYHLPGPTPPQTAITCSMLPTTAPPPSHATGTDVMASLSCIPPLSDLPPQHHQPRVLKRQMTSPAGIVPQWYAASPPEDRSYTRPLPYPCLDPEVSDSLASDSAEDEYDDGLASDAAELGSLVCSEALSFDVDELAGMSDRGQLQPWGSDSWCEEDEAKLQLAFPLVQNLLQISMSDGGCLGDGESGTDEDEERPVPPCEFEFRISTIIGPHKAGVHPPTPASGIVARRSMRRLVSRRATPHAATDHSHHHLHQQQSEDECDAAGDDVDACYDLDGDLLADPMEGVALRLMLHDADFCTPTHSPSSGRGRRAVGRKAPTLFSDWLAANDDDLASGKLSGVAKWGICEGDTTPRQRQGLVHRLGGEHSGGYTRAPPCSRDQDQRPNSPEFQLWGRGRGQPSRSALAGLDSPSDSCHVPVEQLCTLEEFNAQLVMAARDGNRGHTSVLWLELCNKGIAPDLSTLNTMIRCLAKSMAHPDEAEKLAREVCQIGCLSPDTTTYNLLSETRFRYEQLCGN